MTRILVVENEAIVAEDIRQTLVRQGYDSPAPVATGEEAISRAAAERPDLVMMDIVLRGGMDGTRAASEIYRQLGIPIVFLTAHGDEATFRKARQTGAFGYLLKPFDASALGHSIEMALLKHRAERSLVESQRQLVRILDSLPAIVYVSDLATDELVYVNRETRRVFGETVAGGRCWELLQETGRRCDFCTNPRLVDVEGRPTGVVEYQFRNTRNGRWYLVQDQAIRWTDERLVRLEVAVDVTAERELREQDLQQRKLESIGILAGGIAHDFNNLLQAILSDVTVAQLDLPSGSPARESLDAAAAGCLRAADLSNRLLTFTRGGIRRGRERTDLEALARSAVAEALEDSGVEALFAFGKDVPPVAVHPRAMKQVFRNLATNAREAMAGRGRLEIRGRRLELGAEDPRGLAAGSWVEIVFTDEGPGIPAENLGRLFDPYFSTKPMGPEKGQGLGLAICHSVVRQHGGTIGAASVDGRGARVSILLPAEPGA